MVDMNEKDMKTIKEYIICLRESCYEGEDGTWDCSTEEGKEGFLDMVTLLKRIASLLKIELPEHPRDECENAYEENAHDEDEDEDE